MSEKMTERLAQITRREMFARARKMLARKYAREPNWVVAMAMLGVGSTYAWEACREMGIDPDGTTATIWSDPLPLAGCTNDLLGAGQ